MKGGRKMFKRNSKRVMNITILLLLLIIVLSWAFTVVNKNLYPQTLKVVNIQGTTATLETNTGIRYIYPECEDMQKGDLYSCIMWGMNTERISDDKIIRVRYAGF